MLGTMAASTYPPPSAVGSVISDMPVKMEGQSSYIGQQSSPYMQPASYSSIFRRGGGDTPDSSTTAAYPPMFASSLYSAAAATSMDPLYGLHDMSAAAASAAGAGGGHYGGYAGSMAAYGYMSPYYRYMRSGSVMKHEMTCEWIHQEYRL